MSALIANIFRNIPAAKILQIANEVAARIKDKQNFPQAKAVDDFVTDADLRIQELLIDYFDQSALAGQYLIKAEEEFVQTDIKKELNWQLIIDPLDGTNAFCQGLATWGTMVGLADLDGNLRFSWNLLSTGKVFSSFDHPSLCPISPWLSKLKTAELVFDVFDYGAGIISEFSTVLSSSMIGKVPASRIKVDASAAAVWSGWRLITGQIDGLLWLPSENGKRFYPDYDLTFIEPLRRIGWQVALSSDNDQVVQMLAIAPTLPELKMLWNCGNSLLVSRGYSEKSYQADQLKITSKYFGG